MHPLWFIAPDGQQFPAALFFKIGEQAYLPPFCAETRKQAAARLLENSQPLTVRYLTVADMEVIFALYKGFYGALPRA
jgi:hypothetical protein